jgi:hypothetical protein
MELEVILVLVLDLCDTAKNSCDMERMKELLAKK